MKKIVLKKITPYALATIMSLTLSSCSKEIDCEIPSWHVHKYTKEIDGTTITLYLDDEHESVYEYNWNDEYIEITKDDKAFFKETRYMFDGKENWDYLFNLMKTNHDYLKFYYEYTTTETYTTTDDEGNRKTHKRTVYHDGWTRNPNYEHNTGKTRLYHPQYVGYRIINNNGKYIKEKSKPVDDIREIIEDYPYFYEDCIEETYVTFKFKRRELKNLRAEELSSFPQPDLTTNEISLNNAKKKTR